MITKIEIENFKCFEKEAIEIKPLTILTGTNSSGKSSLIQALLISGDHASGSDMLDYIGSLGDFDDLKNKYVNPKKYSIEIFFSDGTVSSLKEKKEKEPNIKLLNNNLIYPSKLTYLNSNRITIGEINTTSNTFNQARYFGIDGKFVANYYEKHKEEPIEEFLIENKNMAKTLEAQVNYWLGLITTHQYELQTKKVSSTMITASYKIDGLEFKPSNIGAGISYIATILIACLSASRENIIIIENPEIHLHPRSQAMIGKFLSFIASKGVQLIVETHNDHLINKIRYEVYKQNIKADDVIIHYKTSKTNFEQIYIKQNGFFQNKEGENSFPSGFYDATIKEIFEINKASL